MHWKLKARIQNTVSLFPFTLSYSVYYLIQRYQGGLQEANPLSRLQAGIDIVDRIYRQNQTVASKTFLEIGTGPMVNVPIALWLCGAEQVITVDLNRYLKPQLIFRDIAHIRENQREIIKLFGKYADQSIFQERFGTLLAWRNTNIDQLLDAMNTKYLAPANAAYLDLEPQSIDYHVSYTVLEHIPPGILHQILLEGKRVLRSEGLFVHLVDLSDHFSHSDKSISAVNFLQFSETEWSKYAGNRYSYHNRLRIDEFVNLLEQASLKIVSLDTKVDPKAKEVLDKELLLDERFRGKPTQVNATISARVIAIPRPAS